MSVQHNIADLNQVLGTYQKLRNISTEEVLSKQGGKLGREGYFQLLKLAPEAGSIRLEVFNRLLSGRGIKIRPEIKAAVEAKMLQHWVKRFGHRTGKRKVRSDLKLLNARNELVKREIGVRESGRRILAISAKYPAGIKDQMKSVSRYGTALSAVSLKASGDTGFAQFRWGGLSKHGQQVAAGLRRPRAQAAIATAIRAVHDDIMVDVRRRQAGVVTKTVKKMVSGRKVTPESVNNAQAFITRMLTGK